MWRRDLVERMHSVCYIIINDIMCDSVFENSKWRTTPVVEEVFAEVLAQVVAAEAVDGAAVHGAASPRTRR